MNEKKEKNKVSLKEEILASIILIIGIGLIVAYVLSLNEYIKSETELLVRRIDSYSVTAANANISITDEREIEVLKTDDGKEFIKEVTLDATTVLKPIGDKKYAIYDSTGEEMDQTTVLDDSENAIDITVEDGNISFGDKSSFIINQNTIRIANEVVYVNDIPVMEGIIEAKTTTSATKKTTTKKVTTNTKATNPTTVNTTTIKPYVSIATKATTQQYTTAKVITTKRIITTTAKKVTTKKVAHVTNYVSPIADYNEMLRLVNEERVKAGVPKLKMMLKLNQASQVRAKESSQLWSHTRPNGKDAVSILADYGLRYSCFGENLTCGSQTPAGAMEEFMNSSSHRQTLLNSNYKYMGVGYYYSANDSYKSYHYWSQLFYTA